MCNVAPVFPIVNLCQRQCQVSIKNTSKARMGVKRPSKSKTDKKRWNPRPVFDFDPTAGAVIRYRYAVIDSGTSFIPILHLED